MSTTAALIREIGTDVDKSKIYEVITVHWDGYLSGVGKTLLENYNTEEKVNRLFELGQLSCLKKNIDPNPNLKHTFDYPQKDTCIAYHRDRCDEWEDCKPIILRAILLKDFENKFMKYQEEFNYFWKNGRWRYREDYSKNYRPLTEKAVRR